MKIVCTNNVNIRNDTKDKGPYDINQRESSLLIRTLDRFSMTRFISLLTIKKFIENVNNKNNF